MDARPPGLTVASGYVLAGGRSSRMGRDKARLPWRDRTLIDFVASEVETATGSVASVGGDPVPGLRFVPDAEQGFGPVSGILAALRDCCHPWSLVVACDMPGVSSEFLTRLLEAADGDGVVPVTPDGRQHLLCAVWSAGARDAFEAALAGEEHTVRRVVERLQVVFLPVRDEAVLRNVNTPGEYADALAAGARE